jgi:hypothetical protein
MASEAVLGWDGNQPLVIKVEDQASEFTVANYQVTPYGILVDIDFGTFILRRFVPWQQLDYLQQSLPMPDSNAPAPETPSPTPEKPSDGNGGGRKR